MAEEAAERVTQAEQPAPTTPNSYAEAVLQAVEAEHDITVDSYGDETFSPRGEQTEAAPEGSVAAPTGDTEEQVSQEEPATVQPTFDLEQDRAAGFDVDSPIYQAALARVANATTTQGETGEENEADQPAGQEKAASYDEPTVTVPTLDISFEGFEVARLASDHPLAGLEDAIGQIAQDYVKAAVSQVNKQNQEFAQTTQLQQTTALLEDAVTQIEKGWGKEMSQKTLKIMGEYPDMARQTPRKFLNLAVSLLGIDPSNPPLQAPPVAQESPAQPAPAASQPQADPKRIARQVVSQQTRPAAPAAAVPGRPKQFSNVKDAVKDALERELAGT